MPESSASPILSYTAEDVAQWLGAHEVAKAQSYLPRVRDLEIGTASITALVSGSARDAYRATINFVQIGRGG